MPDKNHDTDNLFAQPLAHIEQFSFNKSVVDVFPDMIKRSVPGYSTIIGMTGDLAQRFAQDNTRCYDLGCSLGAASLAMRHSISAKGCQIIAIDNSPAMVEQCSKLIARDQGATPVQVLCQDLADVDISNASVVVLNFTLQFIPRDERKKLLLKIYKGMNKGGVLVLSEKVIFADNRHDELMIELYYGFKKANGYSDLEIAQKREALENVLIPESLDNHRARLKECGFEDADVWFQCFNFASLLAQKS